MQGVAHCPSTVLFYYQYKYLHLIHCQSLMASKHGESICFWCIKICWLGSMQIPPCSTWHYFNCFPLLVKFSTEHTRARDIQAVARNRICDIIYHIALVYSTNECKKNAENYLKDWHFWKLNSNKVILFMFYILRDYVLLFVKLWNVDINCKICVC